MSARFHEILLTGPRATALGFIEGYASAKGMPGLILDAEVEGIECASLRERLRELVHPSTRTLHLLVPREMVPLVQEAAGRATVQGIPTKILIDRPLAGMRFSFTVRVYSKDHADRIRARLTSLPQGVRLSSDASFEEELDPDAIGIESYAAAHAYEMTGRGSVEGAIEGVLAVYRFCRDEELIQENPAELIPEAADPGNGA